MFILGCFWHAYLWSYDKVKLNLPEKLIIQAVCPNVYACLCALYVHFIFFSIYEHTLGFPGDSVVKNLPANAGDMGSIPGSGRSPGEGNDYPLQYLAWVIPWTEKPGGLQNKGIKRISQNLATEHTCTWHTHVEMWGTYPYFYSLVLPSSGIHV